MTKKWKSPYPQVPTELAREVPVTALRVGDHTEHGTVKRIEFAPETYEVIVYFDLNTEVEPYRFDADTMVGVYHRLA